MKINESKLKVQIANICSLSLSHWPGDCTHGEPPRSNGIVRPDYLSFFGFFVHLSLLVALVHFLCNPVHFFCYTSFVLCLPIELSIVCTQTFNVEACSYWTLQFLGQASARCFPQVVPGYIYFHFYCHWQLPVSFACPALVTWTYRVCAIEDNYGASWRRPRSFNAASTLDEGAGVAGKIGRRVPSK